MIQAYQEACVTALLLARVRASAQGCESPKHLGMSRRNMIIGPCGCQGLEAGRAGA